MFHFVGLQPSKVEHFFWDTVYMKLLLYRIACTHLTRLRNCISLPTLKTKLEFYNQYFQFFKFICTFSIFLGHSLIIYIFYKSIFFIHIHFNFSGSLIINIFINQISKRKKDLVKQPRFLL